MRIEKMYRKNKAGFVNSFFSGFVFNIRIIGVVFYFMVVKFGFMIWI